MMTNHVRERLAAGVTFVSHGSDYSLLADAAKAGLAAFQRDV